MVLIVQAGRVGGPTCQYCGQRAAADYAVPRMSRCPPDAMPMWHRSMPFGKYLRRRRGHSLVPLLQSGKVRDPGGRYRAEASTNPRPRLMSTQEQKRAELRRAALEYHEFPTPGKVAIASTKQMINQRDLALAYSPGVAAPCEEIVKDPNAAFKYTSRGNLVAVITNGTAVLGLGDIGPLASKPVMEGKGVLFKKFAGVDVFDIEIDEKDPARLVDIIVALEPTFGAINL